MLPQFANPVQRERDRRLLTETTRRRWLGILHRGRTALSFLERPEIERPVRPAMSAGKLTERNVGQSGRVHARILDAYQWVTVSAPEPGKKRASCVLVCEPATRMYRARVVVHHG